MAGKRGYQDQGKDPPSGPDPRRKSKRQQTSCPFPSLNQSLITEFNLTTKLVTESFDAPPTAASNTQKQAAIAYHKGEMIKSANLFLKCWRILHIEHTNFLAGRDELLPNNTPTTYKLDRKDLVRECQARAQMSHCVLADLALVCLYCTGEYRHIGSDNYYSYTLDRFGISDEDYGHTTTDGIEIDGKIWPRGSRVYHILELVDDIGYKISSSSSFAELAYKFADHGLYILQFWQSINSEPSEFINCEETLRKISIIGKQEHQKYMVTVSADEEMEF